MSDNRRGLLCLSLAGPDAAALIRRAEALIDLADLVELRLDSMQDPDIRPFCRRFATPVLATNRPTWEGGKMLYPLQSGPRLQIGQFRWTVHPA